MSELDKDLLAAGEQLFERPWLLLNSVPALEFLPPADRIEAVRGLVQDHELRVVQQRLGQAEPL